MYVCIVTHYSKSMDQPSKVANPARGQLNRVIEFRVRDHCWHACSGVGEGKYKNADSKTLY